MSDSETIPPPPRRRLGRLHKNNKTRLNHIPDTAIKRLSSRAGVAALYSDTYFEIRRYMDSLVDDVITGVIAVGDLRRKVTLTSSDLSACLAAKGMFIYGIGGLSQRKKSKDPKEALPSKTIEPQKKIVHSTPINTVSQTANSA